MTNPNSFSQFSPPLYYPRPVSNYLPSAPVATNSWFQNALSTLITDTDRIINSNPWYWLPRYQNPIGLALDHEFNQNTSVTLSNGNFSVQNNPNPNGVFNLPLSNIQINKLYDMSAELTLITPSGTIKAYPTRGSVLATLDYINTPIELELLSQGIQSLVAIPGGYQLETSGAQVSSVTEDLYPQSEPGPSPGPSPGPNPSKPPHGCFPKNCSKNNNNTPSTPNPDFNTQIYTSKFMVIYNGVIPTNDTVSITLGPNSVNFKFLNYNLTRALNDTLQELLPPGVTQITSGDDVVGFVVQDGTTTYTMTVNTKTRTAAFVKSVPVVYRWLLYTSAVLNIVANKIQSPNFTGLLQLAALGSDASQYATLTALYNNYIGSYTKKWNTSNYNLTTFQLDLDLVGNKSLHVLPVHWNQYTLSNTTKINTTFFDLVYGNMCYYEFNSNIIMVNVGIFPIPTQFDVSGISGSNLTILKNRVISDAQITTIDVNLNPYDFGIQAATAGSIIALAIALGVDTDSSVVSLKDMLISALTAWLSNNNNPLYYLSYEPIWKGVIVPADSLAVVSKGPTAYGNSFYNDHHFHYGYIIYSIWAALLYQTTHSISPTLNDMFPSQIKNLLYDVCNPDQNSTFSTKLRHKDFYAGHSWATGIGVPQSVSTVNSSPIRQQESSGEAINCYYSCYLLANLIACSDVVKIASLALKLELDASKAYYQLLGAGTSYGDFLKVAGVGIILNIGKAFTLDWQMQPNTYNGRAIGLYGIQAIPFTEISFTHISTEWANKIVSANALYSVSSSLVEGLTNNSYTPLLFNAQPDPFNVQIEGGFWGNVGNMLLARSSSVLDVSIMRSWFNLLQKQTSLMGGNTAIKNFSSYSNTLYWLLRNNRFSQPLTQELTQVNVLGVKVLLFHQNGDNVDRVIIAGCGCGNICIDVDFDLNSLLVGGGMTLGEKALAFGVDMNEIVNYVGVKFGIQYNLISSSQPSKLLLKNQNSRFLTNLQTQGFNLKKYLNPYPNFESFFI